MQNDEEDRKEMIRNIFWFVFICFIVYACSYSIVINQTDGTASDMVEESDSTAVDTNVSLTPKL